ncbi:MAG: PfkB family carbohydrate kinase [Bacteroidales bacterium]|nr:PfkB family carbohydrate kinase [Bacteroidales bacterium]
MIYTIGETVLDIILKEMQPQAVKAGGSALNTAVSLAQLGNSVSFISELGTDTAGTFITGFLYNKKVDTSHIISYAGKTSLAIAYLNEQNDAQYQFYKDVPDSVEFTPLNLTNKDIVLFSSSYAITKRNRKALMSILKQAQHTNALRIYDPNIRKQIEVESDELHMIEENFDIADIVRASDEDCAAIFNTRESSEIFARVQKHGVSVLIITKNKNTVKIHTPHFSAEYSVPEIHPVSTIGAGDTFNAGIIHCLTDIHHTYLQAQEIPIEFWNTAIPFAIECAGLVCQSYDNYLSKTDTISPNSFT